MAKHCSQQRQRLLLPQRPLLRLWPDQFVSRQNDLNPKNRNMERGMAKQEQSEAPEISEEDKKRLQKATTLLTAYTNFMRWAGNFRRDEIKRHPRHASVVMLSTMQSSRFAFAVEGSSLLLAAQPFEMTWLSAMPFDSAYVSDRLYLSTDGAQCMEVNLPPLTIGIWCDQKAKREEMAQAN